MGHRKSLTETVLEKLLAGVMDGQFPPGSTLPSEADIAASSDVSRVTVREALKTLQAGNVVTIRRGIGTSVNPPEEWTSLESVLMYASRHSSVATDAADLIEVRRMVETGAAALAARHRTETDLVSLEAHIVRMESASAEKDVDAFVQADIAFHDVILRASRNLFVPVLFEPLSRLLRDNRARTSAVPEIQRNAIAMHRGILAGLSAGDPELSRLAMDKHMDQTVDDLERYVLGMPVHRKGPELTGQSHG